MKNFRVWDGRAKIMYPFEELREDAFLSNVFNVVESMHLLAMTDTGMTDCEGNPVYEEDILQGEMWMGERDLTRTLKTRTGWVFYDDRDGAYKVSWNGRHDKPMPMSHFLRQKGEDGTWNMIAECKVVGNTLQQPRLCSTRGKQLKEWFEKYA